MVKKKKNFPQTAQTSRLASRMKLDEKMWILLCASERKSRHKVFFVEFAPRSLWFNAKERQNNFNVLKKQHQKQYFWEKSWQKTIRRPWLVPPSSTWGHCACLESAIWTENWGLMTKKHHHHKHFWLLTVFKVSVSTHAREKNATKFWCSIKMNLHCIKLVNIAATRDGMTRGLCIWVFALHYATLIYTVYSQKDKK